MRHHKLPNYLRTYRKRAGLSQDEVAYVLGCKSGSKVSRYERFARTPTLETTFAYEALFKVPASDLFSGIFQRVERDTAKRAKVLVRKIGRAKTDKLSARKLDLLRGEAVPRKIHG